MAMACPNCDEVAVDGAQWCEACGADLDGTAETALSTASSSPCISCAAPSTDIAADGYCGHCGAKQPDPRDHFEVDLGWLVMVTDRGKRHHQNEDFGAVVAVDGNSALVVCDGVSSTDNPEQASAVATEAAIAVLEQALRGSDADLQQADLQQAMSAAIGAAQEAALTVPTKPGGKGSPSCTFVASVARASDDGITATIGWLGDSRAYWIDEAGQATQLTSDHSWANEQVRAGAMTSEQAAADRRAHTITRWLGDDADGLEAELVDSQFGNGWLLLCTDGLWNYAPDDASMTTQIAAHRGDTLLTTAQNLVNFALESGGHDNTTVAIADHTLVAESPVAESPVAEPAVPVPASTPTSTDEAVVTSENETEPVDEKRDLS